MKHLSATLRYNFVPIHGTYVPRHATLHYTTLHYTTLHYTALHYTTLHYTTLTVCIARSGAKYAQVVPRAVQCIMQCSMQGSVHIEPHVQKCKVQRACWQNLVQYGNISPRFGGDRNPSFGFPKFSISDSRNGDSSEGVWNLRTWRTLHP